MNLNLDILNFLIGIQKGSRLLSPYSNRFSKLGFEVWGIERELPVSN
jgi:hypothetical protein